jgi:hypothetical protein
MLARILIQAGIVCFTAACGGQADAPQTVGPEVGVMTLQPQRVMLVTELPGHTSAFLTAEVRPQVTGTVLQRQFEEGTSRTYVPGMSGFRWLPVELTGRVRPESHGLPWNFRRREYWSGKRDCNPATPLVAP